MSSLSSSDREKLKGVYYRLFETMRNGFAIHEIICDDAGNPVDYRFLDISPSFERLTGLDGSIVGKRVREVLPDTEPYWIEEYGKVALTGEAASFTNYAKALDKYFEVTAYAPAPMLFATIFEDVTEQVRDRLALEQSQANLNAMINNNPDMIFSLDRNYRIVLFNNGAFRQFKQLFDVTLEQGKNILALIPEKYRAFWKSRCDLALEGKRQHFEEKRQREGITHYGEIFLNPIEGQAPQTRSQVDGVAVYVRDITARKAAEQERVRLSMAIEQLAEVVVITDSTGNIVYVNPAFERVTGYRRDEVIGQNPRLLQSGDGDDAFYRKLWDTVTSGSTWHGIFNNRRKDGAHYIEKAVISPVTDVDGDIVNYVAVKRDITDEQRRETQLRQADKMEALGYLAGGISHDFNNILGAIMGYTELLMEDCGQNEVTGRHIQQILLATERAKQLVNQILSFSRQQKNERILIEVRLIVEEVVMLLRAALPSTVTIETHISEYLPDIIADPIQIHELIMNLCTNGAHAMADRGILRVICETQSLGEAIVGRLGELSPGKYVVISIEDSGVGMDANVQQHMFDPFFTTREVGKGTGMGLSVVFGILQEHGGNILVDSEPGKGTTIAVLFPAADKNSILSGDALDKVVDKVGKARVGIERILVVDGDIGSASLVSRMLREMGYQVMVQSDPRQAIHTIEAASLPFDLVIANYRLPETNGAALLGKISIQSADTTLVLLSGPGDKISPEEIKQANNCAVWQKPFSKSRLRLLIAELGV